MIPSNMTEEMQAAMTAAQERLEHDTVTFGVALEQATAALAMVERHPHYHRYTFGGVAIAAGQGAEHILAFAGLLSQPAEQLLQELRLLPGRAGPLSRLEDLTTLAQARPELEGLGLAALGDANLLEHGAIPMFWLMRPKLGLGYAVCLYGLRAEHAQAYVGLLSIDALSFAARVRFQIDPVVRPRFGDALAAAVIADDGTLAGDGRRVLHDRAASRYWEDCASFADWQAENPDRTAWTALPPNRRQGHLARTTCDAKRLELPSCESRGRAADWLDREGANLRFRKG